MSKLVSVNIYEIDPPKNKFLDKIGMGLYHSGVVINGIEWAFGEFNSPNEDDLINEDGIQRINEDGIQSMLPGTYNEYHKQNLIIGEINISDFELECIMNTFRDKFLLNEYDLIKNNCNHFTKVFCKEICNYDLPKWINRAANISSFFYCASCCNKKKEKKVNYNDLLPR